jgi:DNA mismatch repair ATPase MutS
MFVPAVSLSASVAPSVRTHFPREEDATLAAGRLDEELRRLAGLVDATTPGTLVLLNESLSTTNEREGAAIARGVVDALLDAGVAVWFVTHNHQLASELAGSQPPRAHVLRAERGDWERPFRLTVAPPLPTSHGMDLYRRIFPPPDAHEPRIPT